MGLPNDRSEQSLAMGVGGPSPQTPGPEARSHVGARPVRRRLTYYFANVTSWSAQAEDFLRTPSSTMAQSDVVGVVEHHKKGPGLVQAIKRLSKLGWKTSAVAAAATGTAQVREGQGHGGVWVASRNHLQHSGLTAEMKVNIQAPEHAGLATQWTARTVRASGHDVLFVAVYLAPGLGLTGTNITTLKEVGAYIKCKGMEFVRGATSTCWRRNWSPWRWKFSCKPDGAPRRVRSQEDTEPYIWR